MFQKPSRHIFCTFIHCSASDKPEDDNIEVIRRWHLEKKWNDVGYHYFIRKNGTIEEGRSLEEIPAAQKGHNFGSIAICVHGLDINKFTVWQLNALRNLCNEINEAYDYMTFHGHCEVNSNKTCPVFNYKRELNLDENGKME